VKKCILFFSVALFLASGFNTPLSAHCQIPCGIYGDDTRFALLKEDIETVEKSMKLIVELSATPEKNFNQIVRWVQNKEVYANQISETVVEYFLKQRVSPIGKKEDKAYSAYIAQLEALHQLLVFSMRAKQSTDLSVIEKLREALKKFDTLYKRH